MANVKSLAQSAATALKALGWQNPIAQTAVRAFQVAAGFTGSDVDGKFGPGTRAKMVAILGEANTPAAYTQGKAPPLVKANADPIAGLRQIVADVFADFSEKFEGYTTFMYTDSKGLVTTGIGNLIDPLPMALQLPWRKPDGSLASQSEVAAAFNAVKSAWPGVQSVASQSLTNLRLDKAGIVKLVNSKLNQNVQYLKTVFPNFPSWPADAQLAINSISWAWGPGFARVWGDKGAAFIAAVNKAQPDFRAAADILTAASVHEESINPGIVPRDAATKELLLNAADVITKKANPDQLYWPDAVTAAIGGATVAILAVAGYFGWQMLQKG